MEEIPTKEEPSSDKSAHNSEDDDSSVSEGYKADELLAEIVGTELQYRRYVGLNIVVNE